MYEFKDLYTIDFTNVQYYFDMYFVIKKALDFPEYSGYNWDAVWDCLTDMVGRPVHIEIIGLEVIERKFGDSASKMVEILKRFKHYNDDKYAHEIQIEIVYGDTRVSIS